MESSANYHTKRNQAQKLKCKYIFSDNNELCCAILDFEFSAIEDGFLKKVVKISIPQYSIGKSFYLL